ncbi:unnamed protein product [Heligmosomoides polygyrus]|uniref:Protein kinase domain-containing protein n=1 Tax=Heligmosomoides polygyrus TaxID=6339 RepID=A0A3P7XC90_HELPZ|nr:unnamed protein product [Heligmosomoides polygyrus]
MRDELRRHQSLGSEEPQTKFNETPFDAVFEVQDELGRRVDSSLRLGQFAVVRKVVKKATGEEFAAKFIKKRRYATSRRGVAVLRSVGGHSNVIELHEVYETPSDVILVLELVSGGELFDHVCARECLDEVEAAAFVGQILLGIKHLHSLHIVHLDIKPENVMLKRRGDAQVKLIDFGLSRLIPPGHTVKDMVGTPEFVGTLSGGSPFLGDTRDETFCNITGVNYHFTDRYFKNTSSCAKDFISRLFVRDVQLRATVHDCLRHPWIRGPDGGDVDLRKSSCIAISHIHSFKQRQRWRKAVELVLACNRVTRSIRLACRQSTKMRSQIESRYDPNDLLTSSLLIAAESGSVRELNELSVARGFPNLRNKIPLHWAARSGHANIVAVLANERVNVNAVNKDGESSLLIAARYGHVDVVHVLLDRGASTTLQDQVGSPSSPSASLIFTWRL